MAKSCSQMTSFLVLLSLLAARSHIGYLGSSISVHLAGSVTDHCQVLEVILLLVKDDFDAAVRDLHC